MGITLISQGLLTAQGNFRKSIYIDNNNKKEKV